MNLKNSINAHIEEVNFLSNKQKENKKCKLAVAFKF